MYRGLSPRVRGNLGNSPENLQLVRSIPACAGEPAAAFATPAARAVYPRVCGGTSKRSFLVASICQVVVPQLYFTK